MFNRAARWGHHPQSNFTKPRTQSPKRLTQEFHHHHDLSQATLHVHLDPDSCLEVTVLKGRGAEEQAFVHHAIAERGVRHGHVVYVPTPAGVAHSHSHDHRHTRTPRRTRRRLS